MDKSDLVQLINRAKNNKVTELDLSNRGIFELPDEIGELISLKSLNLSYNNITFLPSGLCNLVNLQTLFLTRNNIARVPLGISSLTKLKVFDISYNPVEKLPVELGLLGNLELLDASFCNLQALPIELTNLYGLKSLVLEENPMVFPPKKVIKRGLYAIMHYLTIEKRKQQASKVMMQIFNMPEKIQVAFRQYVHYFEQMVGEANQKEVVFDMNFINQDFYKELDLQSGVEGYLYDVMRYIHEKVETLKLNHGKIDSDLSQVSFDNRMNEIKARLSIFNHSIEEKIEAMQRMKHEIKGLHDSLPD